LYAPFCGNLTTGVKYLLKKKEDPAFLNFLRQCKNSPDFTGKLDLEAYLLKPMQRVSKIPLLMKAIMKNTSPTDPDYSELEEGAENRQHHFQTLIQLMFRYIYCSPDGRGGFPQFC